MDILHWIIFGAAVAFILWYTMVWMRSSSKSAVAAETEVVKMRAEAGPLRRFGTAFHANIAPGYRITFEFLSGDNVGRHVEFFIRESKIDKVEIGDRGTLTMQGIRFINFERKYNAQSPQSDDAK